MWLNKSDEAPDFVFIKVYFWPQIQKHIILANISFDNYRFQATKFVICSQ
jgi:hypothetical protein